MVSVRLLSIIPVIHAVPGIFFEWVASCIGYLVKVHSPIVRWGIVSSWPPLSLSPHVVYLWPVSLIIVIIIVIVSRAIIAVVTIRWVVIPVVVPEVVIIIVSISVKISGPVIAP